MCAFLFEKNSLFETASIATGIPPAALLVGILTNYTFRVPLPGTKVGIERGKRKKPE